MSVYITYTFENITLQSYLYFDGFSIPWAFVKLSYKCLLKFYTCGQKFGIPNIFFMFMKEVSYAYQGCIFYYKKIQTLIIVKYYHNIFFYFNIF